MAKKRIVVIGGGPAGVAAAVEAAAAGGAVTLVHAEPIGGRAAWHSLIPSKVYLTAADRLEEAEHQQVLGLAGAPPIPALPVLRERIAGEAQAWSRRLAEELAQAGVAVVSATAKFAGPGRVDVTAAEGEGTALAFDKAVIASGSLPIFLPEVKPDGRRILAPRLAGKLAAWPEHLIMIGGGVTGAEFAYLFRRMGCRVTWVTDQPTLVPRTDPDLAAALERSFVARGVDIVKSAPVVAARADKNGVEVALEDGRRLAGSHAFIAIGRHPDLAELDLDRAGIRLGGGGVAVDGFCRTSNPDVYAVGDVTGPPYVANRALAQARVAARHALGGSPRPFRPDAVVEAIYTLPQLATVGLSEAGAAGEGIAIRVHRFRFGDALKPRLVGAPEGFVKVVTAAADDRIVGGGAFGDHAADVLTPIALAVARGLAREDLAELFPAYPCVSELAGIAVRGYAC
jgi:dihydrolipoamide dehydrogenase